MNKTFRYRIYPTDEQKTLINKTIGCCRKVYNELLADCEEQYKTTGKSTVKPYKFVRDKYDYMKEVDAQALNYARRYLKEAFDNFFKSCKGQRGGKSGYPKKKYKQSAGSYTTYISNCTDNSKYLNNGKLALPKMKEGIKVVWHRKFEGQIKHVTVSRTTAGEYYVSICTEVPESLPAVKIPAEPKVLGIDMALDCLAVYSDGTSAEMPHIYRSMEKRLKRAQKKLSRKVGSKKGETKSNNFYKQRHKVAKLYERIENTRKDFLDKESNQISENFDVVVIEDINMQAMGASKGTHGKSVSDIGFGEFRQMLEYKMARNGKKVVKASRHFPSSQLCSNCGFKNIETKKYWKVQKWTCPQCGMEHDLVINGVQHGRDFNAAKNLKQYYFDNPDLTTN